MDKYLINNKGIATVMAVGIMLFIMSIAIAVIPSINNILKQSALSADFLKAQNAAEAGAKRAVSEMYQGVDGVNYSWTWLGIDKNLSGTTGETYEVSISGATNLQGNTVPGPGHYTVTSIGKYGNKSKTVKVDVDIQTRPDSFGFGIYSLGDIYMNTSSVNTNIMSTKSIDLSLGNAQGLYTPEAKHISTFVVIGDHAEDAKDIYTDGVYPGIRKMPDSFFSKYEKMDADNFLTLYQTIEPGRYEVNGDLNFVVYNALNLSRKGNAIIHVKGNLNVAAGSRIGFILSENKNFFIIVDGNVNIYGGAGVNNAVILSYGNVTLAANADIKGSIQAAKAVTGYAGTSYFYDDNIVKPFRQYASEINYGTDETFKVSNWH